MVISDRWRPLSATTQIDTMTPLCFDPAAPARPVVRSKSQTMPPTPSIASTMSTKRSSNVYRHMFAGPESNFNNVFVLETTWVLFAKFGKAAIVQTTGGGGIVCTVASLHFHIKISWCQKPSTQTVANQVDKRIVAMEISIR